MTVTGRIKQWLHGKHNYVFVGCVQRELLFQ